MTMLAVRLLIWTLALGFTALFLFGCSDQPEYQLETREWKLIPMTGGPSIYTACIRGDRLYALQKLSERSTSGLWPGASIAVSRGGC